MLKEIDGCGLLLMSESVGGTKSRMILEGECIALIRKGNNYSVAFRDVSGSEVGVAEKGIPESDCFRDLLFNNELYNGKNKVDILREVNEAITSKGGHTLVV